MTREEKILMAIDKGYTCNPETGEVYGVRGGVIITKDYYGYLDMIIYSNNKYHHIKAHQFMWYWVNKQVVNTIDHINGIKNDNRITNLRSITIQQNTFNRKNAKGYYWNKSREKWHSAIIVNKKSIYLGSFVDEEEASQAYLEAKKIYHII